jgi:beta-mannanase
MDPVTFKVGVDIAKTALPIAGRQLKKLWRRDELRNDGSTPLPELFPGADEVDWLAVDGYNWGSARDWGWQSYADIFAPTLNALHKLAPRRPLMFAETGSAPDRRKASWVTDTLTSARADGVDALVWFEFSKETDWRLSASPAVSKAARTVVRHRAWRQAGDLAVVERAVSPRR